MVELEEQMVQPLVTIADVIAVIEDLCDDIPGEELDAKQRIAEAAPRQWSTRSPSGGAPSGGPTNRLHDFATGRDGAGVSIPQHSDPVGEAVAWNADDAPDARALRDAYQAALRGMRALEECRSHLARTRRREQVEEQRDRHNCWPCLDIGVRSEVYRDSSVNGTMRHVPRCRRHYEFALWKLRDAPDEIGVWWAEGRRVSQQMVDAALERAGMARSKKRKAKKGRRR
jgi:hypothetical protein